MANEQAVDDRSVAGGAGAADVAAWNRRRAAYALAVLIAVAVFSNVDRYIFSILAQSIKEDLGVTDGQLGFLYGTAFALFYAVFGIPLARVADSWSRTRLIGVCLGFWSLMTALSGTTRGFLHLSLCRFGVGVGEAGAGPASLSLVYDHFPERIRTTATALLSGGAAIGAGAGLFLGGAVMSAWNGAWPEPSLAPLGLKGWQAAFMVVGLPGLLLAVLVATMKEPARGALDGVVSTREPRPPLRTFMAEGAFMAPGLNLWALHRAGARRPHLAVNLVVAGMLTAIATTLTVVTGDAAQWISLPLGVYGVFSWAQALSLRDRVCFDQIFRCRALLLLIASLGFSTFTHASVSFWIIPFYQRAYGVDSASLGAAMGVATAAGGLLGMIVGGVLADRWRGKDPRGKVFVSLLASGATFFLVLAMLWVQRIELIYALYFIYFTVGCVIGPPLVSAAADLVIPRTRATASAFMSLVMNVLGIALGPYCVGIMSDAFGDGGPDDGGGLRLALLASLGSLLIAFAMLAAASRHVARDELSKLDRARASGEPA